MRRLQEQIIKIQDREDNKNFGREIKKKNAKIKKWPKWRL